MARHETDREDLWAEAIALTMRAELRLPGRGEPLLIGRRPNGWWSVYFGQDVMLQFTAEGRLRRAYRRGELFRTQGATLARLTRERTAAETILRRHNLDPNELAEFRAWMCADLTRLITDLQAGAADVMRLTMPGGIAVAVEKRNSFVQSAIEILQIVLEQTDWLAPPIRGKA